MYSGHFILFVNQMNLTLRKTRDYFNNSVGWKHEELEQIDFGKLWHLLHFPVFPLLNIKRTYNK